MKMQYIFSKKKIYKINDNIILTGVQILGNSMQMHFRTPFFVDFMDLETLS